jgi:hypothetical protein
MTNGFTSSRFYQQVGACKCNASRACKIPVQRTISQQQLDHIDIVIENGKMNRCHATKRRIAMIDTETLVQQFGDCFRIALSDHFIQILQTDRTRMSCRVYPQQSVSLPAG